MVEEVQLREVERNELTDIRVFLEHYLPETVSAYNTLLMMKAGLLPFAKVLVPVDPNELRVVFLCYSQPVQEETYLFCCLESDMELLEKSLRALDWSKEITFSAAPRAFWSIIAKVAEEKNATYKMDVRVEHLSLTWDRNLALQWEERITDDYDIKILGIEHAEVVNDSWRYKGLHTLMKIKEWINLARGFGIFVPHVIRS
ncbi:unnamed protein product [Darwinula stevensoni]|uniref:GNAT family N-acetyltransferase n=1 Tax=Darwinula stevensoni TaxID=69355 RepID=A0A7R9FT58_9CRUS|nr:unnamed protein product [Darwinula stevensoni]CAG0905097.1 unnamed protein product [Darwinula stevensoni]